MWWEGLAFVVYVVGDMCVPEVIVLVASAVNEQVAAAIIMALVEENV